MKAELVVIGGGPAGMAAALAAEEKGIKDILVLERDKELGNSEPVYSQWLRTSYL